MRSLAAEVPHGELDVLVDNLLEVADYGGVRAPVFSRLQAVQPGGLWCAESQAQALRGEMERSKGKALRYPVSASPGA